MSQDSGVREALKKITCVLVPVSLFRIFFHTKSHIHITILILIFTSLDESNRRR